jgi:succinate dehydrogenase / fumarate reductase cytochrome b subunit
MLTMLMSIAHRISGVGNAVGFLLLAWWLLAISIGPEAYAQVSEFFGSIFGRLLLFLFTWSLIHHMLGGIRHLIWDTGRGFEASEREWLSLATVVGSVGLTILIWVVGYLYIGGAR